MNLNETNMEEINVNQIQEIHYQRLRKRVDVFAKGLKQCYRVIRQSVEREDQWCIYTILEIIFGNPLYKIPDCANYVYRNLKKNGFTVKYIFPNHLVIMWSYKGNKKAMIDYPLVSQQQRMGTQSQEPIRALPAPPLKRVEESKPNIGIDILKRGSGGGRGVRGPSGGGVRTTNSTKEFRPSGMFLFNKKR